MPTQPGTIAAVTGVSTKVPDELKMPRTNYSDKAPNTSNEEFLARIANNVKTFPDPAEEIRRYREQLAAEQNGAANPALDIGAYKKSLAAVETMGAQITAASNSNKRARSPEGDEEQPGPSKKTRLTATTASHITVVDSDDENNTNKENRQPNRQARVVEISDEEEGADPKTARKAPAGTGKGKGKGKKSKDLEGFIVPDEEEEEDQAAKAKAGRKPPATRKTRAPKKNNDAADPNAYLTSEYEQDLKKAMLFRKPLPADLERARLHIDGIAIDAALQGHERLRGLEKSLDIFNETLTGAVSALNTVSEENIKHSTAIADGLLLIYQTASRTEQHLSTIAEGFQTALKTEQHLAVIADGFSVLKEHASDDVQNSILLGIRSELKRRNDIAERQLLPRDS